MSKNNYSPILEVQDLSKTYRCKETTVAAIEKVNLSVEKGDIYGIIGLSGAGKSTLLRCLAGLIKPSLGDVFFENTNLSQIKPADLRSLRLKMGVIFQSFNLLSSRTAAGNISYPLEIAKVCREIREKRIEELLGFVGLSSKKNVFISSLSGGEKQRVGIARALANQPDILFCDEATSALDPKTSSEILEILKKSNQELGLTIVLITHDMEVIKRICNKVAVMEEGKIVEKGSVSDLLSDPKHPITKNFLQKKQD